MTNVLREFLQELNQADDVAALIPWKEKDKGQSRLSAASTELPSTITGFKTYLNRLYLSRPGSNMTVYINIHLGHNLDFNDIREALQSWLSSANHRLFLKMLQVEESAEIGWLIYLTREMDASALADEIADMIGINVGLCWKTIPTGAKVNSEKTKVQGLCIEVPAKEKWACQRALLKLYSRTIQSVHKYPNGIRMRFVKMKKDAINMKEKSKLDKLCKRQRLFLNGLCSVVTYNIYQLDYSSEEGVIPTLRQMIMSVTSKNDGKTPLFHCVDMDWRQEGFTFQFSQNVKEEAETVINTLMPHLTHFFPLAKVDDNFTEETCERCEDMIWSDELNMVIDTSLGNDTEDIQEDENLIGFTFNAPVSDTNDEQGGNLFRPARVPKSTMPRDNDSVSTLGGPLSKSFASPDSGRRQYKPKDFTQDAQSLVSSTSTVTLEQYSELCEKVERVASASNTQFAAINNKVSMILSSIASISTANQPGSAAAVQSQAGGNRDSPSGGEQ